MAGTDRSPTPGRVAKPRPAREPLLDVHDIQGNTLAGPRGCLAGPQSLPAAVGAAMLPSDFHWGEGRQPMRW